MVRVWILAAVLLALAAAAPAPAAEPEAGGRFLILADLHFDPMADPVLVDRLAAAEPKQWPAILDRSHERSLGRYGWDTNWRLLDSAIGAMKARLPDPAFVMLPGDLLAHHFRRSFYTTASQHSAARYRAFVGKTMRFLAQEIGQAFPGRPIVLTVGNNDSVCGDYEIEPSGPFLADMLPVVRRLLGGNRPASQQSWTRLGSYRVSLSGGHGLRLISLNTIFFSRHYRNACGRPGGSDPGRRTLAWLARELEAAKRAGAPVWLVFHIPPGIDGYATLRAGPCPGRIVPMWKVEYARRFARLMRRYRGTVTASFAGHTHMDDFRLLGEGKRRYGFVLITPALSPIFGQNPAFRTASFDGAGKLRDETTYDLTNLPQAEASGGKAPHWQKEYTFSREWSLPRIDTANLADLFDAIDAAPPTHARWKRIYPVSSPIFWPLQAGFGERAERGYHCASGHDGIAAYRRCYCGGR